MSTQLPNGLSLRTKGLRNNAGSLVKGCVKDATTKLSVGSIPSNYEAIIYKNQTTKAFGSSKSRFFDKDQSKSTLPDSFLSEEKQIPINVSHSSKGYGSLISKAKRDPFHFLKTPGPGFYNPDEKPIKTSLPKKRRPIFTREKNNKQQKQNIQNPGPGAYDADDHLIRSMSACWKSSFKTNSKRYNYIKKSIDPGPGIYNSQNPASKKVKVTTIYPQQAEQQHRNTYAYKNYIKNKEKGIPGPGFYSHEIPNFTPLYQRIKVSKNFIQGKQQTSCSPHPDAYNYDPQGTFDKYEQKRLLSSSNFMSETKREPFKQSSKKFGPRLADPKNDGKSNFRLNLYDNWY